MSISAKYRIIKSLGNQRVRKFGNTFLVENKTDTSQFVMKVIHKNNQNNHLVEQVRNEANVNFKNPFLPHTVDQFESDQELIIIRTYANGITLSEFWRLLKKVDRIQFLLSFLKQMEVILEVVHSENIIHCDLKPSNIIIEGSKDDFKVHLIDFGMALKIDEKFERKILFPLGFAAPELLLNHLELVDKRTDYYALGVVIWQLFTNELPLTHPNPSIFTNLQLTHPLPDHSKLPKGLYPLLLTLCNKHSFSSPPNRMQSTEVKEKLKIGMDGRYSSLAEFREDIESKIKPRKGFTIGYLFGIRN